MPMPGPKTHGGARPGAGRKTNSEKHSRPLAEFTSLCAEHLTETFTQLLVLIRGATRVELKRARAGNLTRKDVVRDEDGSPLADPRGRLTPIEVLKFPGVDPMKMLVVESKTIHLPPDIRAIGELIQRIAGRPYTALDEAVDAEDVPRLGPADLALLPIEDLDALQRMAARLADGRPPGGPGGGASGEGQPA